MKEVQGSGFQDPGFKALVVKGFGFLVWAQVRVCTFGVCG